MQNIIEVVTNDDTRDVSIRIVDFLINNASGIGKPLKSLFIKRFE